MTGDASTAQTLDYSASPVPVREDIIAAHARIWDRVRHAGAWWTGAQRVEIATEVRNALDCDLCRERKTALSPSAVQGEHRSQAKDLPPPAVDAVQRARHATELRRDGHDRLVEQRLPRIARRGRRLQIAEQVR